MVDAHLPRPERHVIGAFVRRFPEAYLGIRLLGNALFVVGAVLFVTDHQGVGTWFFLSGSAGMLIGTSGELMHRLGRHRLARYDVDPAHPDDRWSRSERG